MLLYLYGKSPNPIVRRSRTKLISGEIAGNAPDLSILGGLKAIELLSHFKRMVYPIFELPKCADCYTVIHDTLQETQHGMDKVPG